MPDAHAPFREVPSSGQRLDSWKTIAEYLGRHITTVQRWEQEEQLPVHRHQHEKRGSVYAYTAELDAWLEARSVPPHGAMGGDPANPRPPSRIAAAFASGAPVIGGPGHVNESLSTVDERDEEFEAATPMWQSSIAWTVTAVAALGLTIAAAVAKSVWPAGAAGRTLSVAVLPLENRSPDQQPDYFVDGMTEALMTDLASVGAIRVIARQSVMQYRNSGKSASVIADELGADALVEGAVQRSNQRVRVNIRLIDGKTSRSLWATTYEHDLGDALTLQAEISRAIVGELHLTLDTKQGERLASRRPSNPEAWDAYLRARFFWNKRTHVDMSRAIEWYERAIERDPASPLVHTGLADVYATLGPPMMPIAELIARGTASAERAIALDPLMGEPYAALGKLRAYAWDWQGAGSNYRKAIERAPGYAPARYWFGSFLANQGRCAEALAEAREAERLDPVSLPGNMVVAGIELKCGRIDEAIRRNLMVLELDPNFAASYELLGRAYVAQGNTTDAIAMLERGLELTGGRPTTHAALGYAYATVGRQGEAEEIANELRERHTRQKVLASAWSVAIVHAGLGNHDAALTWLEHAYDDREEWLEALAMDERFRRLHTLARFQRLLIRLGLANQLTAASPTNEGTSAQTRLTLAPSR